MISVICVYNNQDKLEKYLLKSLKHQTVDYELILVDNTNNEFKSAPKALNYGANKAKGRYLMFVHNDVDLSSNKWLENTEKTLKSLENLGIAGVAGVSENYPSNISNIEHGIPPKSVGKHIKTPIQVETLDECLIIIPKSVFDKFNFDEKLDGWHLWAVDYCLNIIKYNYNVYVIPKFIYHISHGSAMSNDYYLILKIVLEKYKKEFTKIHTTLGVWHTTRPLIFQRIMYFIKVWFIFIFK